MNTIPDFQTLMLPALQFLKDKEPHASAEMYQHIATQFGLSEDDLKIKVPSGQMGLFKNRLTWAVSYLKNAGLVFYPQRAIYQITDAGQNILNANPGKINIAFLKKLEGFQQWQKTFNQQTEEKKGAADTQTENNTPEEVIGSISNDLNNKLAYELLETLKNKSAGYFEFFVLQLLSKMGYGGVEEGNFEVVGQSGDNGIDGIIYQDKLGIDRIYVQAKRWNGNKVQSKDIRDFIGSLSLKGTNKGIFITTSDFTTDALKTVQMNPQNRIILIGSQELASYAIENNIGVKVKKVVELKEIDYDFFEQI